MCQDGVEWTDVALETLAIFIFYLLCTHIQFCSVIQWRAYEVTYYQFKALLEHGNVNATRDVKR